MDTATQQRNVERGEELAELAALRAEVAALRESAREGGVVRTSALPKSDATPRCASAPSKRLAKLSRTDAV